MNKSLVPEIFSPKLNAMVMIFVVNLCSHFLPVHRAKNPDRARTSFQNFVELLDKNKTSLKKIPNKLFLKRKLAEMKTQVKFLKLIATRYILEGLRRGFLISVKYVILSI